MLHLATDTAAAPLAENLLNAYESTHPGVFATLLRGNRHTALEALSAGEVDGALLLYPPETRDLFFTPVAQELLVIIAHPDVPVEGLSHREARAIFAGQITDWGTPGGSEAPVYVVTREEGSSSRMAFESLVMQGQPFSSAARLAVSEADMLGVVSGVPGSVGYVAHSALDGRVKPLAYEDAPPTLEAARDRTYHPVASVVFVSPEEPQGELRAFLDWVLSPEGQRVVERHMLPLDN